MAPTESPTSDREPSAGRSDKNAAGPKVIPYRPRSRPSMALLCAIDDGLPEGEWFRLRDETFTVGRTQGDLVIPHDEELSSQHFEIRRDSSRVPAKWFIRDLTSTNGTFISVRTAKLDHGQGILIGSQRYRFTLPQSESTQTKSGGGNEAKTKGWAQIDPAEVARFFPALIRLTPSGEADRFSITEDDVWVGSDPKCGVVLDDPMTDPRHVRLVKDPSGQWQIADNSTTNGTWLQLESGKKLALGVERRIQAGEQRFLFKLL